MFIYPPYQCISKLTWHAAPRGGIEFKSLSTQFTILAKMVFWTLNSFTIMPTHAKSQFEVTIFHDLSLWRMLSLLQPKCYHNNLALRNLTFIKMILCHVDVFLQVHKLWNCFWASLNAQVFKIYLQRNHADPSSLTLSNTTIKINAMLTKVEVSITYLRLRIINVKN